MEKQKHILVAPLNWGLGHATRCIPIIQQLLADGEKVMIGSDGDALKLLQKEFPTAPSVELPSYDIKYSSKGSSFLTTIFLQLPKINRAIRAEHKELDRLINNGIIDRVISDNRLGLYSRKVKTVIVSHQLTILSRFTTISSRLHSYFLNKHNYCWVPDYKGENALAGRLSQTSINIPTYYLGPLSRFQKNLNEPKRYDLLVLLSGPEPQRGILERKLKEQLQFYTGRVLFVKGRVKKKEKFQKIGNITYYNFLTTDGLQKAIAMSNHVICRSGYSSVMDLAKLGKKAFFIPTPGQTEQEYIAGYLQDKGVAPYATQDSFTIDQLNKLKDYSGLSLDNSMADTSISEVFSTCFSSVNENSDPISTSLST